MEVCNKSEGGFCTCCFFRVNGRRINVRREAGTVDGDERKGLSTISFPIASDEIVYVGMVVLVMSFRSKAMGQYEEK